MPPRWADLVPRLRRFGELKIDEASAALLRNIAPSTIDRLLKANRAKRKPGDVHTLIP